eukprot:Skav231600  [mRNA]  locus=scaffold232:376962:381836:+ [translate_table: standard]
MLTAKCARDAGVSDHEIETHGYSVVALELGSSGVGDQVIPSRATIWAAAFERGAEELRSVGWLLVMTSKKSALVAVRTDVDTALAEGSARQMSNVFEARHCGSHSPTIGADHKVFKFDFEKNEMPNVSAPACHLGRALNVP